VNTTPLVSVIMPVWGAQAFIASSVASVLDQTFVDLELILVDDVSPDRSIEVAMAVAAERDDWRVRVVARDTNGGVSAARNTGLEHARGSLICFIDNDDRYAPKHLQGLVAALQADPEVDIATSRPTRVMPDGEHLPPPNVPGWPRTVSGLEAAELSLFDHISCFPWDKVYRRELFGLLRFPEGILYEDMVLSTLLFHASRRVHLSAEATYLYTTRASSQTWKDLPPTTDLEQAFEILRVGLGADGRGPLAAALRRRRVLMVLILAQRALMRRPRGPTERTVLRHCRRAMSVRLILQVARVDRFLGLASLGLAVAPRAYGSVYRLYAQRAFRIGG
jgi:hypothetical protein